MRPERWEKSRLGMRKIIELMEGMKMNVKDENNEEASEIDDGHEAVITLETPMGPMTLDARSANKAWKEGTKGDPRRRTPYEICTEDYLGGETGSNAGWWNPGFGGPLLSVLDEFIDLNWHTDRLTHFTDQGKKEEHPLYRTVETGVGSSAEITVGATRLIRRRGSPERRLAIRNHLDCDGDMRLIVLFNGKEDGGSQLASKFLSDLEDYHYAHGPLRGAVFDANLSFLPRESGASEKIVLPTEVEARISRHVTGFIEQIPRLELRGMSSNRGVILSGPPGTGKTLLVRSIIESAEMASVICVSPDMIKRGTIGQVYTMARKLSPSLVILEDIDSAGGLHRKIADHPILGEVLQALDGIADNAGVFTLATTNYLENIDDALRDRPGRFERIITIPVPDLKTRKRLIKRLSSEYGIGDWLDICWLAGATDGYTGDWLRNLMQTSLLIALQDGREDIGVSDVEDALTDIEENRMVAYKSTPVLPRPMLAMGHQESYA